jgi:hypothetical protein
MFKKINDKTFITETKNFIFKYEAFDSNCTIEEVLFKHNYLEYLKEIEYRLTNKTLLSFNIKFSIIYKKTGNIIEEAFIQDLLSDNYKDFLLNKLTYSNIYIPFKFFFKRTIKKTRETKEFKDFVSNQKITKKVNNF